MGFKPRPEPSTEHFKLSEFACNDDTPVPSRLWGNIQRLMNQLEVLRQEFGRPINPFSAYRTPEYNARKNSEPTSQHPKGKAADIRIAGVSPKVVADTIERLIHEGRMEQGGLGRYKSFCHYDVRGKRARWGSN